MKLSSLQETKQDTESQGQEGGLAPALVTAAFTLTRAVCCLVSCKDESFISKSGGKPTFLT